MTNTQEALHRWLCEKLKTRGEKQWKKKELFAGLWIHSSVKLKVNKIILYLLLLSLERCVYVCVAVSSMLHRFNVIFKTHLFYSKETRFVLCTLASTARSTHTSTIFARFFSSSVLFFDSFLRFRILLSSLYEKAVEDNKTILIGRSGVGLFFRSYFLCLLCISSLSLFF